MSVDAHSRRTTRTGRGRSAHDAVAHGIGIGIVEGRYPAGSTLPGEPDLMQLFGVSRTALREAFKTLAAKGMIEPKTRVGTRVLGETRWNMFDADILAWRVKFGVDAEFLRCLFEIRQALEPVAAAFAAVRRTDADMQAMRTALVRMQESKTREGFTEADLAFHGAVLAASHNQFMASIGAVIETALAAAFTVSSPVDHPERFAGSIGEHMAIFEAIARGNPDAASEAMSGVISRGAQGAALGGALIAKIPAMLFAPARRE